jgi:hypothetical protein
MGTVRAGTLLPGVFLLLGASTGPSPADLRREPPLPATGDTVSITYRPAGPVAGVDLLVDAGEGSVRHPMRDDGLSADGLADDGTFGASIVPHPAGTVVRYQVVEAGVAPDARRSGAYTVSHLPPQLRINEIIASNSNGPTDGAGQHDDWLEILNRGTEPVDLAGMFLSDDLSDSVQWALPSVVLDPEELVLVWCDNDPEQGPLHTTFNLSKGGGEIGLFDTVAAGNTLLHGFKFGPQNTDVGFGYPGDEGDAPEYLVPQTPGASNDGTAPFSTVVINEFFAGSQLPNHPDWI